MKKKTTKYTTHKKHTPVVYLFRISLVLFVGILFYAATTLFLRINTQQPQCANSKSCTTDLTAHVDNNAEGFFQGKSVIPPKINLRNELLTTPVLGAQTASGEKHIYIDLSTQTLYAYQGNTLILKTLISSGKWNITPTGNFHIWEKLRATRMTGGEGDDAYDLPNVPYVMYFYNDFGLHGAYWHDNFGHPMSHGCINMRTVDAKELYEWADGPSGDKKGTEVSVCDHITKDRQCIQNNPLQS